MRSDSCTPDTVLKASDIRKSLSMGDQTIEILKGISMEIDAGSSVSIAGASGSGKTTLLGILAGLDLPSSGSITLFGDSLDGMDENQRAQMRNGRVGFVFQSFHLLPNLTALENVSLALEVVPGSGDILERSKEALARVNLAQRAEHLPSQLSGGEQQRVALARAMVVEPKILFADEPTGNLDQSTGASVVELMFDLCESLQSTLILVTHDMDLANRCAVGYRLDKGAVV